MVRVKSRRMSESEAIRESLRQRYYEPLSMDYLGDAYQAACLLDAEEEWFHRGAREVTLALQRAG